ncbi:MAG: hypothetical protein ACRDOL_19570 [Streptosporangiaceae bacterium]
MTGRRLQRPGVPSLALTGFWAVVTAGRVLLAAIQRWLPSTHGRLFDPPGACGQAGAGIIEG